MPCGYPLDLYSGHLPHPAPTPPFLLAPALPSSALAWAPWNLGPAAGRNYRTLAIRPPRGSGSTASTPAQNVEPAGFQLCPHRILTLHQPKLRLFLIPVQMPGPWPHRLLPSGQGPSPSCPSTPPAVQEWVWPAGSCVPTARFG